MNHDLEELNQIQAGVYAPTPNIISFNGEPNYGKILSAATLTTALSGSNNDLVFTAKTTGTAGNGITIEYIDGGYDSSLAINATGNAIRVTLARTSGSITSTAAQIKTAIEANTAANALVSIVNAGGNDGSGIVTAMAATSLTGGSDGTVTLFTAENDGLVAVIGRCTETLACGSNATLEVGIAGNTAALIPQTTATTVANGKRVCRSGVISHAPNATPFLAVKAGDIIKITVGTASITDGTIEFQLYYNGFNADVAIKGTTTQGTLQDAATATGNGTAVSLAGLAAGNVAVTGTFVGTVVFETQDASGAWSACLLQTQGTSTLVSSTTAPGVWRMPVGGFSAFRARVSAYTSGTITVKMFAENTAYTPAVQNVGMYEKLDPTNDGISSYEKGWTTVNLTASGQILSGAGVIGGFRVNSTSSGTIRLADNTTAGSGYTGAAMAPAVGVYPIKPEIVSTGGYVTITGTIDVTFWVRQGAQA